MKNNIRIQRHIYTFYFNFEPDFLSLFIIFEEQNLWVEKEKNIITYNNTVIHARGLHVQYNYIFYWTRLRVYNGMITLWGPVGYMLSSAYTRSGGLGVCSHFPEISGKLSLIHFAILVFNIIRVSCYTKSTNLPPKNIFLSPLLYKLPAALYYWVTNHTLICTQCYLRIVVRE